MLHLSTPCLTDCDRWWRAFGSLAEQGLGPRADFRFASGTEEKGQNDYATGDDFRYVDWNRSARLDELVTRQFHGAAARDVYLLLDVSPSLALGEPSKLEAAGRIAAAIGQFALSQQDRVHLFAFDENVQAMIPPLSGRGAMPSLRQAFERVDISQSIADLNRASSWLCGNMSPGMCLIVSDFFHEEILDRPLRRLQRSGFEPVVVQLFAPEEADPQALGAVWLEDVEGGGGIKTNIEEWDLHNYREIFTEFCAEVRTSCLRRGVPIVQATSDTPTPATLEKLLRISAACRAARRVA